MGMASSIALGLAMARPDLRVVVLDGDGSILMNLGSLATEITSGVANLVHVIWDNGGWEITGGQPAARRSASTSKPWRAAAGFSGRPQLPTSTPSVRVFAEAMADHRGMGDRRQDRAGRFALSPEQELRLAARPASWPPSRTEDSPTRGRTEVLPAPIYVRRWRRDQSARSWYFSLPGLLAASLPGVAAARPSQPRHGSVEPYLRQHAGLPPAPGAGPDSYDRSIGHPERGPAQRRPGLRTPEARQHRRRRSASRSARCARCGTRCRACCVRSATAGPG